ncbi:TPA: restriction endonuclease subunit S, partial [Streptococcus suis]|nr:restriction endonuclease subunit S [Streptococcus suis]
MKPKNNIPAYRFQGYTDAWELRKLGEIADVFDGTHQTPKYTNHGVMFLSVEDIATLKSEKYISLEDFEKEFKIFPEFNDVLMTRIGDIGTSNIVKTNDKIAYYVSLALIKPRKLESHFLNSIIKSKDFQNELWKRTLHIAFPKKINKGEISEVNLKFPSLPEQEAIGTFFSTLDRQITLHQRKLDTLKEQKKTYLKLLFPAKGQTKPALRFQGFEDDWEEVKLGEMCTIQGGNAWKSDSYSLTGEYLVVTIANVTGEYFIDDKKGNRIDINPNEMQYVLKKGDILISLTGNVGRVSKMTESKGVLNQRVGKLTTTANFEFIFSILRTEKFENEMRLASQGAAQANISNKD